MVVYSTHVFFADATSSTPSFVIHPSLIKNVRPGQEFGEVPDQVEKYQTRLMHMRSMLPFLRNLEKAL